MRQRAGLDQKAYCLGNGHQESLRLGMRDCHRAATEDLLLKNRDDASAAPQYIAEPNTAEKRALTIPL